MIRARGVELRLRASGDTTCHLDPQFMRQVMENLVVNALDALEGVQSGLLRLGLSRTETGLLLHVEDNGPGVAPASRESIFEPYVTGRPGGTGLGLALVRQVVEAHGGRVSCGSSELGGACFELWFPL